MNKYLKLISYTFFLFITNILFCHALEYSHTSISENTKITDYIGLKDGYITLDNNSSTKLKLYNLNNELLNTKELIDLENSSIIKNKDNYIIVGLENNMLTIYYLNNNFQVLDYINTTYSFYNTTFNLYEYNNKIYILPIKNNLQNGIYLYELDNHNILKNPLSSYSYLQDILKSDYILINNNMEINTDLTYNYQSSTYRDKTYYLAGSKEDELLNKEAVISIYNELNEKINEYQYPDYYEFINIDIINNNIIVLGSNKNNLYDLLILDLEGHTINTYNIGDKYYQNISLSRMHDNLIVIASLDNQEEMYYYKYDTEVIDYDNIFGTMTINDSIYPYNEIHLEIKPNSGYMLKEVIVKDDKGNIIPYDDGSFIMPTSNVSITTNYEAVVKNPETADNIIIIIASILLLSIITIKLYKKLKWLG